MSLSKEEKLRKNYTRVGRQVLRSIIYVVLAVIVTALAFSVSVYIPSPYAALMSLGGFVAGVIMFFKGLANIPSYEKKMFRRFFGVYQELANLQTLDGWDLSPFIFSLYKLSKRLERYPLEGNSDLIMEINLKFAKISQYVKTKIIAYLQKNKDLEMVMERILGLADVFSDISIEKVDSYLASVKDVPDEEFHAIPSISDTIKKVILSDPILRLGGEFVVCLIFVTVVAFFLSVVLSTPIANFGGYILVASFALLATWEARRR